jgi:hypothetical protein
VGRFDDVIEISNLLAKLSGAQICWYPLAFSALVPMDSSLKA